MAADLLVMLDGLRATRDADSCLRGLNLFRKGLRAEEGPAFLARYLRQSPDWQELQAVWDTQLTVRRPPPPAAAATSAACKTVVSASHSAAERRSSTTT